MLNCPATELVDGSRILYFEQVCITPLRFLSLSLFICIKPCPFCARKYDSTVFFFGQAFWRTPEKPFRQVWLFASCMLKPFAKLFYLQLDSIACSCNLTLLVSWSYNTTLFIVFSLLSITLFKLDLPFRWLFLIIDKLNFQLSAKHT